MNKTIIPASIRDLIYQVTQYGIDRGNDTRESLNQIMILEFQDRFGTIQSPMEGMAEREQMVDLYEDEIGKRWHLKHQQEIHHYLFLHHGLFHKINATKYFHNEDITSRKIIIFSDDCISSIQLIVRPEEIGLDIHMRSSDLINLLPLDIIALYTILKHIIEKYHLNVEGRRVRIHVTFGSLHIYKDDLKIARKVGISHTGEVYDETIRSNL